MPRSFQKTKERTRLREDILSAYLQEREEGFNRKEATQTVADQFNYSFSQVRNLIDRWKPKAGRPTRLPKQCRLTFEEEALTVGLLLGMANISKPLSIGELLKIVNERYKGRGKAFTEHWARKFLSRWSDWISAKQTRLISTGRSCETVLGKKLRHLSLFRLDS